MIINESDNVNDKSTGMLNKLPQSTLKITGLVQEQRMVKVMRLSDPLEVRRVDPQLELVHSRSFHCPGRFNWSFHERKGQIHAKDTAEY